MGNPTIRTQDNRESWRDEIRSQRFRFNAGEWLISVERWRPSLLWRVMHRLGVA